MKKLVILLLILLAGVCLAPPAALTAQGNSSTAPLGPLHCVAFGPYLDGLNPNAGPHPSAALIDTLLDVIVNQTNFRCIMTYGVRNGLDYIFQAASARKLKVIAIIWLDTDGAENELSIAGGIQAAKAYPDTIIRLSCGSEVRTRNTPNYDGIIRNCLSEVRAAGVTQPITSIDTWWEWCNESWPCQQWDLANDVDWIGINVFPWWENKYSGLFPCTTAADAAAFHIARLTDVANRYSNKQVVLTEFGWPAGPDGYTETNRFTQQHCGVASQANHRRVLEETLAKLDQLRLPGVAFEAFREGSWKEQAEGPVGTYWGDCDGVPPYTCLLPRNPDLFFQNTATGDIAAWYLNGTTITGGDSICWGLDLSWKVVDTPDLNGDWHPDLLFQNTVTGDIAVWYLSGITVIGGEYIYRGLDLDWKIVGAADVNADGHPDLYFQHSTTGNVAAWYLNKAAIIGGDTIYQGLDLGWKIVGKADVNADGRDDLILQHQTRGDIAVWYLQGKTVIGGDYIYQDLDPNWKVVATLDLNVDGQDDLILQHQTRGDIAVWYLNGKTVIGGDYIYYGLDLSWKVVGPK